MPIKSLKPITPGQRGRTVNGFDAITTDKPEKSLLVPLKKSGGRNSQGKMTMKFRGGGHKKKYRIIDFKRDRHDEPAEVISIEYDPNRSAFISLIKYDDGEYRYILSPKNVSVGDKISSGFNVEIKDGNCLPLKNIPIGTYVHNIELKPGAGGQLVRSAGTSAQIVSKEDLYVQLKLVSGEIRLINKNSMATIGVLSNPDNKNIKLGKAGRKRYLGFRPKVRGVVMNPVDHPHGGGEGRTSGGRHPVTPWGVSTKGKKTRNNKKTNTFIIRRRKK